MKTDKINRNTNRKALQVSASINYDAIVARLRDTDSDDDLVDVQSMKWLQKIIKRNKSAFVIGDDRLGKVTAAKLCQWEDDSLQTALGDSEEEVLINLWELENFPIPPKSEWNDIFNLDVAQWREVMSRLTGKMERRRYLCCSKCHRRCEICQYDGLPPEPEDISGGLIAVSGINKSKPTYNPCVLIKELVEAHLMVIQGTLLLAIPTDGLLPVLNGLNNCTTIVLLTKETYTRLIGKNAGLKGWSVYPFPKATPDELLTILKTRIGRTKLPFPEQGIKLIAHLADGNCGKFLNAVAKLVDNVSLNPSGSSMSPNEILSLLGLTDEKLVIQSMTKCINGWHSVDEILNLLKTNFGISITSERLGRLLGEVMSLKPNDSRKRSVHGRVQYNLGYNLVEDVGEGEVLLGHKSDNVPGRFR